MHVSLGELGHPADTPTNSRLFARLEQAGQVDLLGKMDAEYRRLEAESWLERERMAKA